MSTGWYGDRVRWSKALSIREFEEARKAMDDLKSPILSAKIVENNTLLIFLEDGRMILRLHKTNILTRMPNNTVVLTSGGWLTKTTKNCICEFLPKFLDEDAPRVSIYSERGVWKVMSFTYDDKEAPLYKKMSIFYDGMVLDHMGAVLDPRPDIDAETKKIRKQIAAFCKTVKEWPGKLPMPDLGDCIPCCIESEHPGKWSKDHLLSHLEEGYVHGTLIYNALVAKGYKDAQLPYIFGIKDIVVRALRFYFKKRLGLSVA